MGKKKDKVKLPKQLGGVKLPKDLRKAGAGLIEKAQTPHGREAIAVGLTLAGMAAELAAKKLRERNRAERPTATPGTSGGEAANDRSAQAAKLNAPRDPHDIGVALGTMAQDVLGRLFTAKR